MLWNKKSVIAIAAVGCVTFGAALAATEFAWASRNSEVDEQLSRIGEIYLDGLAASLKASIERGSLGEVDRRLRSAMNEQNGIAERAILVFDDANQITSRAGFRGLFTDARMSLTPGGVTIDRAEQTMFVARRLGDGAAHVAVALNIEPLLKASQTTRYFSLIGNLFAGILSAMCAAFALAAKPSSAGASATKPSAPRLVA